MGWRTQKAPHKRSSKRGSRKSIRKEHEDYLNTVMAQRYRIVNEPAMDRITDLERWYDGDIAGMTTPDQVRTYLEMKATHADPEKVAMLEWQLSRKGGPFVAKANIPDLKEPPELTQRKAVLETEVSEAPLLTDQQKGYLLGEARKANSTSRAEEVSRTISDFVESARKRLGK